MEGRLKYHSIYKTTNGDEVVEQTCKDDFLAGVGVLTDKILPCLQMFHTGNKCGTKIQDEGHKAQQ